MSDTAHILVNGRPVCQSRFGIGRAADLCDGKRGKVAKEVKRLRSLFPNDKIEVADGVCPTMLQGVSA